MKRVISDPAVAARLIHIRHRAGLTQATLARKWKVSQTCIKTFEGGRVPHPTFLLAYADLGGVTLDWILLGKVDERLINRRLALLDARQQALIGEAIELLSSGGRGCQIAFKAVLEILSAGRDNLDKLNGRG